MSKLGESNTHGHIIHTRNARPVNKPPYMQSPQISAETKRLINEML